MRVRNTVYDDFDVRIDCSGIGMGRIVTSEMTIGKETKVSVGTCTYRTPAPYMFNGGSFKTRYRG